MAVEAACVIIRAMYPEAQELLAGPGASVLHCGEVKRKEQNRKERHLQERRISGRSGTSSGSNQRQITRRNDGRIGFVQVQTAEIRG